MLITLPLEFVLGARVYRRPRRLLLAVLPLLVIFYVWDAVAIARGHWDYSPAHTTGWLLPFAVPVEEVVFFIVIPLCGLLTFEAVGRMLGKRSGAAPSPSAPLPHAPETCPRSRNSGSKGTFRERRTAGRGWLMPEYTVATVVAVVVVVAVELLWARTGIFRTAQYWITMAIVFFFQVLVDGWLTKLSDPIVRYAPAQFAGIRFPFDIPIEDFGFGFALVTGTIIAWQLAGRKETRMKPWSPGRDRHAVRHVPAPPGADPASAPVGRRGRWRHRRPRCGDRAGRARRQRPAGRGGVDARRRVRAWPNDTGTMSRGFHAFFRQYYNLRALLRRTDPTLSRLVPIDDYPLQLAAVPGRRPVVDSFTNIPRTPPWNLAGFVARSPSFGLVDLTKVDVKEALGLLQVRFPETYTALDGAERC